MLFVPVLLGVGIALWFHLPLNAWRQAALLAALALALAGLSLGSGPRRQVVLAGLLVALGLLAADYRAADMASPVLHHRLSAAWMEGEVKAVQIHAGGAQRRILLRRDETDIDPPVLIRLGWNGPLDEAVQPGARIAVRAMLGPVPGPAIPGAHDPARRAWFEGVSASGRLLEPPRLLSPPAGGGAMLAGTRARLSAILDERVGGDAGAVAVALVVGDQGRVSPALIEAIRISGLAHLLTVSGFHVGVLVGGVLFIARRLLGLWPWFALRVSVPRAAAILAGVAGTGYALLSGADVPAVRAAIMAWVVLFAMMLGRDPLSPRLLAFAATLILLARPEAMMGASFQLSFAAVLTLVVIVASPLGQWLRPRPDEGGLLRFGRLVVGLLVTGLAIELVLTPIALAHFGRAGVYGVFANLLAIPLTSLVIMPLLGVFLLLAGLGLEGLAIWALKPAIGLLAWIAREVAAWPGATLSLPAAPPLAHGLFLAGGLLAALLGGRLRLLGLPPLMAATGLLLLVPRPDILVSPDGRQVGVVQGGQLHMLRAHRGGFVPKLWAEATGAPAARRLHQLPGARCTEAGCLVEMEGGFRLLALTGWPMDPDALARACATADLVIAPEDMQPHGRGPDESRCAPRWRLLDRTALVKEGAVAIHSASRRMKSTGLMAGDHPWSPSALPGMRQRLLGPAEWTGVMVE